MVFLMDNSELLMQFSLTRHEGTIYLTLLSEGDLNGYEVSKITGISRSNAYASLASLVEKGGAFVIEGDTTRYTPVPIEEFCGNKIRKLQETKRYLIESIPQKREEAEGYITITGENHILNKMKNMIAKAKSRVYLSVSVTILQKLLPEIEDAIFRGIKIVVITDVPFSLKGIIVYLTEKSKQQIRLIADSAEVLTGDIDDGEYATCLYSRKKNLVDLLKDSLRNEIQLIEMTRGSVDK